MKLVLAGCCALLSLGMGARAATEFPDGEIPEELLREFGGGGQFYRSLPDGFPLAGLRLDVDLRLVGSMQAADASSQVLLRSTAAAASVAAALAPALSDSGWQVVKTDGSAANRYAILCHDTLGELRLNARDVDGGSLLALRLAPLTPALSCAAQKAGQLQRFALTALMNELLPVLELPAMAASSGWTPGHSGNLFMPASVHDTSRQAVLQMPATSAAALYEYFAAQFAAQDWHEDSGAQGERTASGLWLRLFEPEPGIDIVEGAEPGVVELIGALTVIDHGADRYELKFSMQVGSPSGI